jgi:Tol biopolymer transport system component
MSKSIRRQAVTVVICLMALVLSFPAPYASASTWGGDTLLLWSNQGAFVTKLGPDAVETPLFNVPDAYWLSLSPDGHHLAYLSSNKVTIRDIVHGTSVIVSPMLQGSNALSGITWAPDSSRLAFVDIFNTLFVVSAEGNVLTTVPQLGDTPSWSPDGQWIAYGAVGYGNTQPDDLYKIHPDGSGNTLVASHVFAANGGSGAMKYSPGGDKIAGSCPETNGRVCVYTFNTGDMQRYDCANGDLAWAPDDRRLAATCDFSNIATLKLLDTLTGSTDPVTDRQIQPVEAFDSTSSVNNSEGFFQL